MFSMRAWHNTQLTAEQPQRAELKLLRQRDNNKKVFRVRFSYRFTLTDLIIIHSQNKSKSQNEKKTKKPFFENEKLSRNRTTNRSIDQSISDMINQRNHPPTIDESLIRTKATAILRLFPPTEAALGGDATHSRRTSGQLLLTFRS